MEDVARVNAMIKARAPEAEGEMTQHEIKVEIPNTIFDFFRILNQYLDNNHRTFVFLNTNDDNYNFILIFTEELPRYLEMGFEEI